MAVARVGTTSSPHCWGRVAACGLGHPMTSARNRPIFGAIRPRLRKGAGLVMPWCDTQAMQAHLMEISASVELGAHAVVILDQAGWHMTDRLDIPDNITLLPLPPRAPELKPVENIWQCTRANWIFQSYDDIVDHCCNAWNKMTMSIGLRKWAHGF